MDRLAFVRHLPVGDCRLRVHPPGFRPPHLTARDVGSARRSRRRHRRTFLPLHRDAGAQRGIRRGMARPACGDGRAAPGPPAALGRRRRRGVDRDDVGGRGRGGLRAARCAPTRRRAPRGRRRRLRVVNPAARSHLRRRSRPRPPLPRRVRRARRRHVRNGRLRPHAPPIASQGWKVSAVGDSVLLGAANAVEYTLTGPAGGGVLVNAAVSRHAGTCIEVLRAFAERSVLAPLVIVHCGNNGALGPGFVDQVMQYRGHASPRDVRHAQSATRVAGHRQRRARRRCRALRQRGGSTTGTTSARCSSPQNLYFYSDGYHLTTVGRTFYATHLYKALRIWHWL